METQSTLQIQEVAVASLPVAEIATKAGTKATATISTGSATTVTVRYSNSSRLTDYHLSVNPEQAEAEIIDLLATSGIPAMACKSYYKFLAMAEELDEREADKLANNWFNQVIKPAQKERAKADLERFQKEKVIFTSKEGKMTSTVKFRDRTDKEKLETARTEIAELRAMVQELLNAKQ